MALLKYKNISKMSKEERISKMKELKSELIRSSIASNNSSAKTKEIKKAISRLFTFNKSAKEALTKK